MWTCEACGREFGRRTGHVCVPAMPVDVYHDRRPGWEREVFEAVRDCVLTAGPAIIEPVGVGILFKARRTFAELRPRARWLDLGFGLERVVEDPRITRSSRSTGARRYYGVRLRAPADVDEVVCGWLTEAYEAAQD